MCFSNLPKAFGKFFILLLSGVLLFTFYPPLTLRSLAASPVLGVADTIEITDTDVKDGDIISAADGKFVVSTKAYDSAMIGVVTLEPAVVFSFNPLPANSYPVMTSGTAKINVSSVNGNISAGDALTSSDIRGVAMKANSSGYIIGLALEDYNSDNSQNVGKISASLSLKFFYPGTPNRRPQFDIFRIFDTPIFDSPTAFLKYILASGIAFVSVATGIIYFGRIAKSGVEALGRNPLAGRIIQIGVLINVLVTVALVLGGVVVALLILRL